MNQVQKIVFRFLGENESFFRSLYGQWDHFWISNLEKSTDKILTKLDDPSYNIELDSLELELGSVSESQFNRHFLRMYEEQLENALLKQLYEDAHKTVRKTPIHQRKSALLFHFLLHGSLPWSTISDSRDINALFISVAKNESGALRKFLQTYGHYTGLQQRLVFQLEDKALEEGIRVMASGESHFVISYVRFVQSRHRKIQTPQISQTPYHKTVWQVVYAWLLTNRSSFFNKKVFLQQTIQQLAQRYRMTYSDLLYLLLIRPDLEPGYPVELMTLLKTLRDDEQKEIESGVTDWKKLYDLLRIAGKEQSAWFVSQNQKEQLIRILKKEDNYHFLQLLKERQILGLVKELLPQEHEFVKTYAHELEQHKDKGMLQGKAGSEFRLVKWQIIFPVLLENNGTGFNRRHFVWRVIQKVAAHYNLKDSDVLYYLYEQGVAEGMNKELIMLLREIYLEVKEKEVINTKSIFFEQSAQEIVQYLFTNKSLPQIACEQLQRFIKDETKRNQLIGDFTESQHQQLIITLYRKESAFILSYAKSIDRQENKGVLQGKTAGNYKALKWQFIHSVLLEPKNQVFNKRYFVEKVIRKIAAHHNVKTEELILLFYTELQNKAFTLPFDLTQVLKELYDKTKVNQTEVTDKNKVESLREESDENQRKAKQLLIRYFGQDIYTDRLIDALTRQPDFVLYLEPVLRLEKELRQIVKLCFQQEIDKRFILTILLRLSTYPDRLSIVDIALKIIIELLQKGTSSEQQALEKQILKLAEKDDLLKETLKKKSQLLDVTSQELQEEDLLIESGDLPLSFIYNAGLILLAPFLPRLFNRLELTEKGKFKDREAKVKALFLMQYAVFGTTDFPEHELQLNKLLVGFKTGIPVPRSVVLTEEEMQITDGMLQGVVQHWSKVKTIDGLREGFLQREGRLEEQEEQIDLIVESKAFDVLLDNIPWNFKTTKFSWMEKPIQVSWR